MKLLPTIILSIALAGCAANNVSWPKWPQSPGDQTLAACPNLKTLDPNGKLSDVAKTVADNYTQYYICAAKVTSWQEWYNAQKQIYERAR